MDAAAPRCSALCPATQGEGVGSWIKFTFFKPEVLASMVYYQRQGWRDRNSLLRVEYSDETDETVYLADTDQRQFRYLTKAPKGGTAWVRLFVVSVHSHANNGAAFISFQKTSITNDGGRCFFPFKYSGQTYVVLWFLPPPCYAMGDSSAKAGRLCCNGDKSTLCACAPLLPNAETIGRDVLAKTKGNSAWSFLIAPSDFLIFPEPRKRGQA